MKVILAVASSAALVFSAGQAFAQTSDDWAPLPFEWSGPCGWDNATARLVQLVGEAWFERCVLFYHVESNLVENVGPTVHERDLCFSVSVPGICRAPIECGFPATTGTMQAQWTSRKAVRVVGTADVSAELHFAVGRLVEVGLSAGFALIQGTDVMNEEEVTLSTSLNWVQRDCHNVTYNLWRVRVHSEGSFRIDREAVFTLVHPGCTTSGQYRFLCQTLTSHGWATNATRVEWEFVHTPCCEPLSGPNPCCYRLVCP